MNAVEITGLNWKYSETEHQALKDINLAIQENTFVGIVGPNESGKTTLASCIKGIIPEYFSGIFKGEIALFGKSLKEYDAREISKMVGMVFSDPDAQFTSMSVEEEIAFGLENIGLQVDEIKDRVEWVSKLTAIEDLLEKPPYDLSGGQKQRVAIAAVLAMRPKIIILDEPTSMLDPFSKDYVFSLLQKMKDDLKITIIVIEHNIEKIAELSDYILLMNKGEIEKFEKAGDFFTDIELLENSNIRVPGTIKLINRIFKDKGLDKSVPIKFDEIKEAMEGLLK